MDVCAFSGDTFDVKDWINKAFQQPEAHANKEQHASSLVMKLQLLIAKLNSNLEDQSESVSLHLLRPKVIRDVDSLQQEIKLLQAQMAHVQKQLNKTNSETSSSIQQLVELDQFKRRIQATCKALKEADNWTTLTTEIEDDLDGGDLELVTKKLSAIQSSLKILTHAPDYEERVLHVEGLKNRLEAMSSPHLVQAFNNNDLAKAQFFVKVFGDMERSSQLLKYYRKCTRAKLLRIKTDPDPAAYGASELEEKVMKEDALATFHAIKHFFDQSVKIIGDQLAWFPQVFVNDSVVDNLMTVVHDVFASMDPRLDDIVNSVVNRHSDNEKRELLTFLIHLKKEFNHYVNELDSLLLGEENGRLSARMRDLCKSLLGVFKPHVARYPSLEGAILVDEMAALNQDTSKDIVDELRNVGATVAKAMTIVEEASQRCFDLTEGCAMPHLTTGSGAFEMAMTTYVERFLNLTKRLDKRKTASHSWLILQQSLTLNQVCGDLLLQLEKLDLTLSHEFLERTKPFLGGSSDRAVHQHDLYLLESAGAATTTTNSAAALRAFHTSVSEEGGRDFSMTGAMLRAVARACKDVQSSTFAILFHPIIDHFVSVNSAQMTESVWKSQSAGSDSKAADMPVFSFVPQEYITQVGQYLMTLPQHLEPYMTHDNPALNRAFRERVFPYCGGHTTKDVEGDTPADFLLSCIATATCQVYQDNILKIPEVSTNSTKQLHVDIGYLGDILDDLGHSLTEGLISIVFLLKLTPKEYWTSSTEHPQKLVSTIRKMRNLNVAN